MPKTVFTIWQLRTVRNSYGTNLMRITDYFPGWNEFHSSIVHLFFFRLTQRSAAATSGAVRWSVLLGIDISLRLNLRHDTFDGFCLK